MIPCLSYVLNFWLEHLDVVGCTGWIWRIWRICRLRATSAAATSSATSWLRWISRLSSTGTLFRIYCGWSSVISHLCAILMSCMPRPNSPGKGVGHQSLNLLHGLSYFQQEVNGWNNGGWWFAEYARHGLGILHGMSTFWVCGGLGTLFWKHYPRDFVREVNYCLRLRRTE